MGKLFDNSGLTTPGSALVDSGGNAAMVGDPNKIRDTLLRTSANFKPFADGGTTPAQNPLHDVGIGQPTFQQAATAGANPGALNATSPGLSKLGKLGVLLTSGFQGAMAGRAADEQAIAASGGRRSGGAGSGFQAAQYLPWLRASQQQAAQRGQLENELLQNQVKVAPQLNLLNILKGQAGIAKDSADANKANAEAGAIPAKTALEQAQTEAANYREDSNLGLIDLRTKQPVNPSALAPLTAEEAQVLGKQPGDRVPLKLKATASEIAVRGLTTVNTEEGVFERNRNTGSMTRMGSNPRMMFAPGERIVQVADPNNPGSTTFMKAGDAVKTGAAGPTSASVTVPRDMLKWATSGKGGEEINAFNVALQHADLLQTAMTALDNGDVRTLNSLKNRFKTEFGSSDVSNYQAIANAYTREISKMLSSGHMTNDEINTNGATLPSNASPDQLIGALQAYRALATSKMKMRYDQFQKGMQGKPNFPAGVDTSGQGAGNRPPLSSFEH